MADLDLVAISRWLSSSEFLFNALILIGVLITIRLVAQMLRGGLAETIRLAFTTNWQLTVLATSALFLSIASGWRTWDGMAQFTGESVLSLLITFGIQGVMLIIAWLIGESFAAGLASGRSKAEHAAPARAVPVGIAAFAVGGLVFGALGLLVLLYAGLVDPNRPYWGFAAPDKLVSQVIFVAIGVALIIGLFSRLAAFGGAVFLLQIVLAQPAWPGIYPPPHPSAGNALIVNKEFIEMMALFALATLPVGRWAGLDFFIHYLLVKPVYRQEGTQ